MRKRLIESFEAPNIEADEVYLVKIYLDETRLENLLARAFQNGLLATSGPITIVVQPATTDDGHDDGRA